MFGGIIKPIVTSKTLWKGVAYSASQGVGVGATIVLGIVSVKTSKTITQKLWIGALYTAATFGQVLANQYMTDHITTQMADEIIEDEISETAKEDPEEIEM